jgi:hypothetical protein
MTITSKSIRLASSVLIFVLNGCNQSEYTKLVNRELAKGMRYDSVLLGIKFGDKRKDFQEKCFDLNRKKMVMEAASYWVRYIYDDSTMRKPAKMNLLFYPTFDDGQALAGIDMKFSYEGWSPWNKNLQSDQLQETVKRLLVKWYGGNEFVTAHVNGKSIPVKLDGNRRIIIYDSPPQHVIVRIQDILHPMFSHNNKD